MASRWSLITLIALLFLYSVKAQDTDSGLPTPPPNPFPPCSWPCLQTLVSNSSCMQNTGTLDGSCVCNNADLNNAIIRCAEKDCNVQELLTTKNATVTVCGQKLRSHSSEIKIIGLTLGSLAVSIFVVRIVSRLTTGAKSLFPDDWVMCVTVAVAIPPIIFTPWLGHEGLGRDIWTLPFDRITTILKLFFFGELFYFFELSLVKISILLFLQRIFPVRRLKVWIYATMGLCVAYGIAFVFGTLFQCSPVSYSWNQWKKEHHGTCTDYHKLALVGGLANIFLDVVVLVLPLREVARLPLSKRKRFAVMLMFLVGLFTTVVSAVRLKYQIKYGKSTNPTYDWLTPGFWTLVEIYSGIICACMPAIYALIKTFGPRIGLGTNKAKHSYGSSTTQSSGHVHSTVETLKHSSTTTSEYILLKEVEPSTPHEQGGHTLNV